jgi:S-adenosylmethionine decarboxylase
MQIVTPAEVALEVPTEELGRWQNHKQLNEELAAPKDHFIERDGVIFAGTHLLIDLQDARHLDDIQLIESAMRECVAVCGATLLHIHLHHFTPSGGVSGVAVLAESHISVHTWPERDYAAFDVFMCGDAEPENAVAVLKRAFHPRRINVCEELRGRIEK